MTDYRYQVGGSLNHQDISYIEREADFQLYQALQNREFCYVLNSRQMGKSSLLVRTKHRLERENFCCAAIDLTGVGSEHINPEQWYKGIISQLYLGFNLIGKINFKQWWSQQEGITLIQKLNNFIVDILLVEFRDRNLVIFIDEIDSVFGLPFSTDDFFAFIRFCYNQRSLDAKYERINFAIFGVATPSSLIRDKQRTPFNIGKAIELTGFSLEQSLSLTEGFNLPLNISKSLLEDILHWTAGQPFLTQKLCQLLAENIQEIKNNYNLVDNLVRENILHNWKTQDDPEHLRTISNRILHSPANSVRLLGIYQQILLHESISRDDSPEQIELLLSGLVVDRQGHLEVKNLIYQTIFNLAWIESHLAAIRPYSLSLKNWLDSHKQDQSQLLQDLFLQQALEWAKDKQIADIDYQFLSASQELAKQKAEYKLNLEQIARKKVEIALEAAREAHEILVKVKHTVRRKYNNFRLNKIWLIAITLNTTILIILLRFTGWLEAAELSTLDRLVQIRPHNPIKERIVVIAIEEEDIQKLAEYPVSDRTLATAISKLNSAYPRVIGLDIYRDLPVPPGNEELTKIFNDTLNIWGIEKIVNSKVNPPKVLAQLNRVGFNDLILDKDGRVRRGLLSYKLKNNQVKYSFALQMALKFLESSGIKPQTESANSHQIKLGKGIFNPLKNNEGGYVRSPTGGYQILIDYLGNESQFNSYSLNDLLSDRIPILAIKDRLVLIGVTASSVNDFYQTPYSSQKLMPGVFIHANIINQIIQVALSGKGLFRVLSEPFEWIWILLWTSIGTCLGWLFKSQLKLTIAIIIALLILSLACYQLFLWYWWLPIIPAILGLVTAAITTIFITNKQKSKVQLQQTIQSLLSISQDKPAPSQIAIEYLKQGESEENKIIIEQSINKKLKTND
ncbi:MAG: hypothetical protein Tsb0014_04990 [Pleurocapsa sp.]